MNKFATILLIFVSAICEAQQKRVFTPARGHYLQLQQLSAKGENVKVDAMRFPEDAAVKERRLSLKPIFLESTAELSIPNPPANSSAQTRHELNYLLALQAQRTKLDVMTSLHMANIYYNPRTTPSDSNYQHLRENLFFIGRSIGTWFNSEMLPKTATFMARVWQDAGYFIWKYKYQFARVRPYVLDSAIQNLEETNWPAYPSGHAANSYINAYIFSELAPEFADVFLKDAYDMAHSREIIGVHFPSDTESSRILARELVNRLFENSEFKKEFAEVKAEWRVQAKEKFQISKTLSTSKESKSCATTCKD